MTEEELERRRKQNEEELDRYRRFLKLMFLLLLFWFVMLYFIVHHDLGLIIAGIVILAIWIFYMCMCIFGNLFLRFRERRRQRKRRRQIPSEDDGEQDGFHDEEEGLTGMSSMVDRLNGGGGDNQAFSFPFGETAKRIKSCREPTVPGRGPTNGTYTAVFSAVYFNRVMRSEGKLQLEFYKHAENGWKIQGESNFGKDSRVIREGFVNAKGEMYWKVGNTIHRGILDFASSCMFDGEFVPKGDEGPVGRIVRIELAKAAFYTSSVEMVSFTTDDDDTDEKPQSLFE